MSSEIHFITKVVISQVYRVPKLRDYHLHKYCCYLNFYLLIATLILIVVIIIIVVDLLPVILIEVKFLE
jgi:Fe2+ transport system protein B